MMAQSPWLWRAPLLGWAQGANALADLINRRYDVTMYSPAVEEYYDHSGFHNYGYWTPQTTSQWQASENLVDVLVRFFPSKKGTVLDVACGMGASTKRLLRDYNPSDVTGINISEKQLATCRQRAPGCRFLNMDATHLKFPDNSFDNILCVEAVFHFDTREAFLREALRVLKPGGCLALSDILLRSKQSAALAPRIPKANYVANLEQYRAIYQRVGFEDVRIIEARAQCWEAFRDNCIRHIRAKARFGLAPVPVQPTISGLLFTDWGIGKYLLVSARKPQKKVA